MVRVCSNSPCDPLGTLGTYSPIRCTTTIIFRIGTCPIPSPSSALGFFGSLNENWSKSAPAKSPVVVIAERKKLQENILMIYYILHSGWSQNRENHSGRSSSIVTLTQGNLQNGHGIDKPHPDGQKSSPLLRRESFPDAHRTGKTLPEGHEASSLLRRGMNSGWPRNRQNHPEVQEAYSFLLGKPYGTDSVVNKTGTMINKMILTGILITAIQFVQFFTIHTRTNRKQQQNQLLVSCFERTADFDVYKHRLLVCEKLARN